MDELDLFRGLGGGPVAPSDVVRRRASAQLANAIEREQMSSSGRLRRGTKRQYSLLAFAAALVVGGATALFLSAPWASSPGFLERAQAALIPPAGSILHYRWEREVESGSGCATGVGEIWIDQAPPHGYRAFLTDCLGQRREVGGVMDNKKRILEFVPPNTLVVPDLELRIPSDPAAELRASIREGSAHHMGTTELGGRTVERIRVDCTHALCAGRPPSYHYVDPETFLPILVVDPAGFWFDAGTDERFDVVWRYLLFEFLPRTSANLALTDIEAQHPDATRP